MSHRIRVIDHLANDHPMLAEWWTGHGFPPVAPAVLPALGVIASHRDTPTAAGWLYMDNSTGVAMLEWLVGNPSASPRLVTAGLGHVIAFLKGEARANGYRLLFSACRQPGLSRLLARHGFHVTDRDVIHHVMTL